MDHQVTISHLRDFLGVAYLHVRRTNEPVIVQRYGKADVAAVPLILGEAETVEAATGCGR